MKKMLLLFFILCFITSCKNSEIKKVSKNYSSNIANLKDYVEPDNNSVNFLFKIPENSKFNFYLGENKDKLKKIKFAEKYSIKKGITVKNLIPGKTYFYKLNIKTDNKKTYSKIYKLKKNKIKISNSHAEWSRNSIFYEIFVRSFYDSNGDKIGDFKGVIKKLPYLKKLGVDAVWLMPTFDSPSYHGYDITDYYNVEPDYGTLADFKKMIEEAHKNNIKIIIDLVVNHTSEKHPWFIDASQNPDSKYRDYYVWATKYDNPSQKGEWGQKIWYKAKTGNYQAIFWSGMPDLNLRNSKVRDEIKKIAKYWLDIGVDGFRLDAAKHIDSENDSVNHIWWKEFTSYVKNINKNAFIVGEVWDSNSNYTASFLKDMDSVFNFKLSDSIIELVQGKNKDIIKELNNIRNIYSNSTKNYIDSTFIRNHDMNRTASQVLGNVEKQKLAFSILFTLPGTPFIYYGEEIGQKGTKPDENIREPFDWYKSAKGIGMTKAPTTYSKLEYTKANDGISLEEEYNNPKSLFNYIKNLIKLRKKYPVFNDGKYTTYKNTKNIISYKITNSNEKILVIHNLKNKTSSIMISNDEEKSKKIILTPYKTSIINLKTLKTIKFMENE